MQIKRIPILIIFITAVNYAAEDLRGIKIIAKDGEVLEPFGQSWAVVIGIDDYQKVGKLKFAVSDAKAVKQMLEDKFGFAEDHIFTLYDDKATKIGILKKIGDDLPNRIGDRDRLLIYFAGHGESSFDNGYLIPVDYQQGEYRSSAISMTELKDILKDIKAKHIYMVLDACYSGMFFTTRAVSVVKDHPRYLQEITKRKARQALTAGGREPVSDGGYKNHSAFTGIFLEALGTGYADYNGDGIITASEINAYIQPKVAEIAEQTPEFGSLPGSEGGEFVFISPSDPSVKEDLRLTEMEKELKEKEEELKRLEREEKAITEKQKAEALRFKIAAIEKETREKEKSIKIIKENIKQTELQKNDDKSLVAYYPFNGNVNDESGNGNNGTVHGATLTNDRFGNENSAYDFDGINDYIVKSSPASTLGGFINGTISAWVYLDSFAGSGFNSHNGKYNGSVVVFNYDFGYCFGINEDGALVMDMSAGSYWNTVNSTRAGLISVGRWYHIAVVAYNNTTIDYYVDGVKVQSNNVSYTGFTNKNNLYFGGKDDVYRLDGRLDEVRIYNRALSESEIKGLYSEKSYNLAADFSPTINPNSVWSYGWSDNRNGKFQLYKQTNIEKELQRWHVNNLPAVGYNPTSRTISPGSNEKIPPFKVSFHPGPNGENSVIRWTAPETGMYKIEAVFMGDNFGYPTSTDVAICHNTVEIFSDFINSYNVPLPVSKKLSVNTGDFIDFSVGYGSNKNYHGDATGIDIIITRE